MSKSNIEVRVATLQDADQISSVLLDFYNMRNIEEAKNAFLLLIPCLFNSFDILR